MHSEFKSRHGKMTIASTSVLALCLVACAKAPIVEDTSPIDPTLESNVLDGVPSDIAQKSYVDFEGKLALIGYAIEPKGVVSPGAKLNLTLYWQSSAPLGPGWSLFTHLLDTRGIQVRNADNEGALRRLTSDKDGRPRQTLPPSLWKPGKVYVDKQEIEVPNDVRSPELTIVTGVWREDRRPATDGGDDLVQHSRLAIISGPTDGTDRAIVARIKTGVSPQAPSQPSEAKPKI
jgi:hypothetical protein